MSLSTRCIGHIMTGSFMGRGNQYTQLVSRFCIVNCRTSASNYQLFPLEVGLGIELQSQWWEARLLPLCHRGKPWTQIFLVIILQLFSYSFIYLGLYVALNTVQVISQRVVGRAEETSTYSWSRFCTVNCRPMPSNYQLSNLR